jgi:hypothetical protein
MPERLFYCGTEPPHDERKAFHLRLAGAAPNVNRRLEHIEKRMVSEIPDHLCDLLDIATYVFVADRMVGRGGKTLPNMGREWHRSFRFSIAVREPDRWNRPEIKAALQDLVGFLSGDDYRFQFLKSDDVPAYPRHLPLGGGDVTPKRFDQVLLFSGGLDSLAGALEELSLTRDRIVLVSHRSSPLVFSRQRGLANNTQHLARPHAVAYLPLSTRMAGRREPTEGPTAIKVAINVKNSDVRALLWRREIHCYRNELLCVERWRPRPMRWWTMG